MKGFKPLPQTKEIKFFFEKDVTTNHIFYDENEAYCTFCDEMVDRKSIEPKHCKDGVCPLCRTKIIWRSRKRKPIIKDRGLGIVPDKVLIRGKEVFTTRWYNVYVEYDV